MMASPSLAADDSLVEEMIFLAGHASSTYLDLFKAYNSVLEANNFDPADDVLSVPLLFSVPLDKL